MLCLQLTLHDLNIASVVFIRHQRLPYFLCLKLSPDPGHLLLSKVFGFCVVGLKLPSESALQVGNCANTQVAGCTENLCMCRMRPHRMAQHPLRHDQFSIEVRTDRYSPTACPSGHTIRACRSYHSDHLEMMGQAVVGSVGIG